MRRMRIGRILLLSTAGTPRRKRRETMSTISISYTTGTDGFGDGDVTEADHASFEAYVEHRLAERFPGAEVRAEVSDRNLESRVRVRGIDVDEGELRSWIGNEIWESWCAGERAPADESEVAS